MIKVKIGDIDSSLSGKQVLIDALIDSRRDVFGMSIFRLYDGSGFIDVKSFSKNCRDLNIHDAVTARVFLKSSGSKFMGELLSFSPIPDSKLDMFKKLVKENEMLKTAPRTDSFTVNSQCYNNLKNKFLDAARLIKKSILESRLIILKHHADCDGYSAALSLESAIVPLIAEEQGGDSVKYFYKRNPMKKPFYEYLDAIKDITLNFDSFSKSKPPLVIIVDNGSSAQDLISLQKLRMYGSKIIVVDHHIPAFKNGKFLIDDFVDVHINPHIVGFTSDITAGMLSYELANFIRDISHLVFLPALSGIGDHSSCREFDNYVNRALSSGYSLDYLRKLAKVLDFEAYSLGFYEGHSIVKDFLTDKSKQSALVDLVYPYVESLESKQEDIVKNSVVKEDIGKVKLFTLDLDSISLMSEYPPPGKISGLCFKMFSKMPNIVVAGLSNSYLTIRTNIDSFDVSELIRFINSRLDFGFFGGGGHPHAGTLKFAPIVKDKVFNLLKEFLLRFD